MSARVFASLLASVVLLGTTSGAKAMEVLNWSLSTDVVEFPFTVLDNARNSTVSNPLHQFVKPTSGPNSTSADYDFSWLTQLPFGSFNTTLVHTIRSRDILTGSVGHVRFTAEPGAVFHLNFDLTYDYTPNERFSITAYGRLVDVESGAFLFDPPSISGNSPALSPHGTLSASFSRNLVAGRVYQFDYNLVTSNQFDPTPASTADIDLTANIDWWVTPEPGSLLALMTGLSILPRARRNQSQN